MSAFDFLRRVSQALDAAGVEYMVTGSFASTHYGEPRTTQDLDMVVRLEALGLERLLASLPEDDWYFSPETARDALQRRRQFNLICQQTGWKADLIVQKNDAFAQAEFDRRRRDRVLGVEVWLASPEDVMLAKLRWARAGGGSQRQLRDVAAMLRLQRGLAVRRLGERQAVRVGNLPEGTTLPSTWQRQFTVARNRLTRPNSSNIRRF